MKRRLSNALALGLLGLCPAVLACQSVGASANPEVPLWVHRASGSMQLVYSRSVMAMNDQKTLIPTTLDASWPIS